jgi:tRNA 2-selenouridine synthase SelU
MQNFNNLQTASLLIIDPKALKEFAKSAIIEALAAFKEEENVGRFYNRHQAAKFLGLHFNTVKKYVENGLIATNNAGKITHSDLLEFQKRGTLKTA